MEVPTHGFVVQSKQVKYGNWIDAMYIIRAIIQIIGHNTVK